MNHSAKLLFVLLAALLAPSAQAITGTEYRNLDETRRESWLVGAVDGILTAQLWQTNKEPEISKCLAGKHPTQIKAIFEKALEASPERWHFPAAFQLLDSLQDFCSLKKTS
jgi:hypothetical protein